MKKLILAAIILVSALESHAQEQQTHSILVAGLTKIDREIDTYQTVATKDEKHFEAAFLNSKEKAELIAKAINKKLEPVLSVTDATPMETREEESFYFKPTADQYLYQSVSFAIE